MYISIILFVSVYELKQTKYEQERDLALQKHFQTNSKRFQSFLKFPQHLCDPSFDDSDSERDKETEVAPSSHFNDEHHEVDIVTSSTGRGKGKSTVSASPAGKSTLRSSMNWKWRG